MEAAFAKGDLLLRDTHAGRQVRSLGRLHAITHRLRHSSDDKGSPIAPLDHDRSLGGLEGIKSLPINLFPLSPNPSPPLVLPRAESESESRPWGSQRFDAHMSTAAAAPTPWRLTQPSVPPPMIPPPPPLCVLRPLASRACVISSRIRRKPVLIWRCSAVRGRHRTTAAPAWRSCVFCSSCWHSPLYPRNPCRRRVGDTNSAMMA